MQNLQSISFILALIAAISLLAAAAPVPEMDASGSAEELAELNQTAAASGEIPSTQSHLIPFECSQENATVELTEELLGSLEIGLKVLRSYSSQLWGNWAITPVSCPTPVPHNYIALRHLHYSLVQDQHMANWAGVFRAYAGHVLSIIDQLEQEGLQEYIPEMQTLYSVIAAVLKSYNQVLLPSYCDCTEGCFTIPQVSTVTHENCNIIANVEYYLSVYEGCDIVSAQNTRYKWLRNLSIVVPESAKPSTEQWVMDNIQPENAPDYDVLLTV